MTSKAIRRRAGETVVGVTLIAGHSRMHAEQRKARAAVIKTAEVAGTGCLPSRNCAAVALLASHRETGQLVIRIRRGFIILPVAGAALQRHIDESAFALCGVTIIAADMLVPPEQWKTRGLMHDRHL